MTGPRRRLRRAAADAGSATALVLLWVAVLGILATAFAVATAALTARTQAASAADLGALAGASAVLDGERIACARAAEVVRANGARIESCEVEAATVRVRATRPLPAAARWLLAGATVDVAGQGHAELVGADP